MTVFSSQPVLERKCMDNEAAHNNGLSKQGILIPLIHPDDVPLGRPSELGVLILDLGGIIRYADDIATSSIDCSTTELLGSSVAEFLPALPLHTNSNGYNVAFVSFHFSGRRWHRFKARRRDGTEINVSLSIDFLRMEGVSPIFLMRISRLGHFPEVATSDFERLIQSLEESDEMAFVTNGNAVIQFANSRFEAMSGFRHTLLQDLPLRELGADLGDDFLFRKNGSHHYHPLSMAFALPKSDGETWRHKALVRPFVDENNEITHFVFTCQEPDNCRAAISDLEALANNDYLTGLPNRRLFLDRLSYAIARAAREKGNFAVLYMDLDRFKEINDSEGHAKGDATLKLLGKRFLSCVREVDTMARIGGDEFACILTDVAKPNDIWKVCEKILAVISQPLGQEENAGSSAPAIGVSIGVAIYPADGEDESSLLQYADQAMYSAKRAGGNRWFHSAITHLPFAQANTCSRNVGH